MLFLLQILLNYYKQTRIHRYMDIARIASLRRRILDMPCWKFNVDRFHLPVGLGQRKMYKKNLTLLSVHSVHICYSPGHTKYALKLKWTWVRQPAFAIICKHAAHYYTLPSVSALTQQYEVWAPHIHFHHFHWCHVIFFFFWVFHSFSSSIRKALLM